MKFKYTVVYENYSDKFDIGHCRTKVQGHSVTLKFFSIYRNTNCVGSHNSTLVDARKLIKLVCLSDNNTQIL